MDVMKKMTFCVFTGHERQKLFWGIIIFIRRVPPSNGFLTNFLTKWLHVFLTSTTQTLPTFNGGNYSFDGVFFIFGCKRLAEFRCGIDLCMMGGYNFSSIMLTFFTET